jgi:hypothetical protein
MRRGVWVLLAVTLTVVLVGVLAVVGWFTVGRNLVWGARSFGRDHAWGWGTPWNQCERKGRGSLWGPGMMGRRGAEADACTFYHGNVVEDAAALSLEEAHDVFVNYVEAIGYEDLEITDVMEFEHNFYAVAIEPDTGMGAMEILLDKERDAIGPEPGPNMMWNGRYGMHGRGVGPGGMMGHMGQAQEVNELSEVEARSYAERWGERRRPTLLIDEESHEFYGYYTFHTLREGQIEGMVSVHGSSGRVWYHDWHGDFVAVLDDAH